MVLMVRDETNQDAAGTPRLPGLGRGEEPRAVSLFAAFPAGDEALLVVDAWGRVLVASESAARLLGYRTHQLVSQPLELIIPRRRAAPAGPARPGASRGETVAVRRLDGSDLRLVVEYRAYRVGLDLRVVLRLGPPHPAPRPPDHHPAAGQWRLLEGLLEASQCALAVVDSRARGWPVVLGNSAFRKLVGTEAAHRLAADSMALCRRHIGGQALRLVRQRLRLGKPARARLRWRRADGSRADLRLDVEPLRMKPVVDRFYAAMLSEFAGQRPSGGGGAAQNSR